MTEYNIKKLIEDNNILDEDTTSVDYKGLMQRADMPSSRPDSIRDKNNRMSFFKGEQGISAKSDQSFNFVMDIVNALTASKNKKYKGVPKEIPESFPSDRKKNLDIAVSATLMAEGEDYDKKAPINRPRTDRFKMHAFSPLMNEFENFKAQNPEPYDSIFNNVKKDFKDVKVSQMTINAVLNFTDFNGPYAQAVKENIGRVATPVGSFQFTGETIRDILNRSKMFTEKEKKTVLFNKKTQDKMMDWYLGDITKNLTGKEEIVDSIVGKWVGLTKADRDEVYTAFTKWKEGR